VAWRPVSPTEIWAYCLSLADREAVAVLVALANPDQEAVVVVVPY
jgi:hypothetical protein